MTEKTVNTARHAPTLPGHLYERSRIFYYRYKLPKALGPDLPRRELRISLRTGNKNEALKLANKLHMRVTEFIERYPVQEEHPKIEANKTLLTELRTELQNNVADILNGKSKKNISNEEIRTRFNKYLHDLLDNEFNEDHILPTTSRIDPDGTITDTTSENADIFDKEADKCIRQLSTLENIDIQTSISELFLDKVFEKEEITSDNALYLARKLLETRAKYYKIKAARLRGDFSYEIPFYSLNTKSINIVENQENKLRHLQTNPINTNISNNEQLLLSKFIEKFKDTKINDGEWTKENIPTHMGRLTPLIEIFGDIPITAITREDMRIFRDKYKRLPPYRNMKKEFKNKSIDEILKMQPQKTVSIKTVNDTIEAISGMFEWGIREEILEKNPAKALSLKDDREAIELRPPLTSEDLKIIFFNKNFIPSNFSKIAYYWVPLISLYSGMRREEICQLYISDIYKEDDIWVFDICESSLEGTDDKHLKTKNARRKIPIHNKIIELGFLEYLQEIKRKNNQRAFPDLKKIEEQYGRSVGKNFKKMITELNIKDVKKKSFHSLRHTFNDFFKKRNLQNAVFTQVFGHEQHTLATRQYGSKFTPKQCFDDIISKLHYDGEELLVSE